MSSHTGRPPDDFDEPPGGVPPGPPSPLEAPAEGDGDGPASGRGEWPLAAVAVVVASILLAGLVVVRWIGDDDPGPDVASSDGGPVPLPPAAVLWVSEDPWSIAWSTPGEDTTTIVSAEPGHSLGWPVPLGDRTTVLYIDFDSESPDTGSGELHAVRTDGTGDELVEISAAGCVHPGRPSVHAGLIVMSCFDAEGVRTKGLHVLDEDGTSQGELDLAHLDGSPSWTPDGKHILFSREEASEEGPVSHIYAIAADGTGEPFPLTTDPLVRDDLPAVSPAGGHVVFRRREPVGGSSRLLVMDMVPGGRGLEATPPVLLVNVLDDPRDPAWSSGSRIMYTTDDDTAWIVDQAPRSAPEPVQGVTPGDAFNLFAADR